MICNLNILMQFIVCHSLFILLKAKRKTILSAGSLHSTSSWPESLLFSAATTPLAAPVGSETVGEESSVPVEVSHFVSEGTFLCSKNTQCVWVLALGSAVVAKA